MCYSLPWSMIGEVSLKNSSEFKLTLAQCLNSCPDQSTPKLSVWTPYRKLSYDISLLDEWLILLNQIHTLPLFLCSKNSSAMTSPFILLFSFPPDLCVTVFWFWTQLFSWIKPCVFVSEIHSWFFFWNAAPLLTLSPINLQITSDPEVHSTGLSVSETNLK